nr:cell division protein CrgA [Acidimicrobiia bacterium]
AGRYTPPTPKLERPSPPWVPALMFALLLAGALVIVLNYLGVLPTESGEASNWWLLAGLGLISAGFVTATQYR